MSQVKECLQRPKECSKVHIAIPKASLKKIETKNCGPRRILTCETIKNRFKYVQPCRRDPYKPVSQPPNVINTPFTNNSVYNHSYYHHKKCGNRPKPCMRKDHIVMAGKFQDQTSQRLSYPAQCVSAVQKIVPKDNNSLRADGPMRMMTTQQHDYYGPCEDHLRRNKKIVQADNLAISSDSPMANLTTTHCSYQPVVCAVREKNFKSEQCYTAPVEKMDLNTTQRSSYKKLEQQEKVLTPWVEKPSYRKSINTVDYCSVYNYSFKEPGGYIDKDNCGSAVNFNVDSNTKNCCPFNCLADNIESELKSRFTKAHEFDD